jgi:hypothetical protein
MDSVPAKSSLFTDSQRVKRGHPFNPDASACWPDDIRNARAADALSDLALRSAALDDDVWDRLKPHFDPKDRRWYDAVSGASRAAGFRTKPADFGAYGQTVFDALAVSA